MAKIRYSCKLSPVDTIIYGKDSSTSGATKSFKIQYDRLDTPPSGATINSGYIQISNIAMWTSYARTVTATPSGGSQYFAISMRALTAGSTYKDIQFDLSDISSSFLQSTSGTLTCKVNGTTKAFDFNSSSAEIVQNVTGETQPETPSASASTISVSPSVVNPGDSSTVSFTNSNLSSMYHKVTWSLRDESYTKTTSVGDSSVSYSIPESWCNQFPSTDSATINVTVVCCLSDGTTVGTRTGTQTISLPSDSKYYPSIGSITATRTGTKPPSSFGSYYVQSLNGVDISVSSVSGAYGSTIYSYALSGADTQTKISSESTHTFSIGSILSNGSLTYTVTVTDSRGRKTSKSVSIQVMKYQKPQIDTAIAVRCNSSGTASATGTSILARVSGSYSTCNNQNSIQVKCSYKKTTESSWTDVAGSISIGSNSVIGVGLIALDSNYQVKFKLSDTLGQYAEKTVSVGIPGDVLYFANGGMNVCVGTQSEATSAFVVNGDWDILWGENSLKNMFFAQSMIVCDPSEPSKKEGMIWLKPLNPK